MAPGSMLPGEQWCYLVARCLWQQGQRDRALSVADSLLRSDAGRPLALRLLAEINGNVVSPENEAARPGEPPSFPLDPEISLILQKL
jgi:hypothetical protein